MQNSSNDVNAPLPPPPPPPPSRQTSLSTQTCKCKHPYVKDTRPSRRSPREDVISALRHITHNFFVENPSNLISLYHPVSPIIQEGRCCGIVALSMASQLIYNISVDDILRLAKSLNFTNEGEMFSAFNMATLCKSLLNCDSVVLDNLDIHKNDLLNHICSGWPVLIPYDADKNHSPCSNNGITAHWAVITGLCFTLPDKSIITTINNSETINEYSELNVLVLNDGLTCKNLLKYADRIFLYAHQGKSKHLAAWDFYDLLKSNKNMYEVTKKYNSGQLVLPVGDSLSELRNKAVLLKKI